MKKVCLLVLLFFAGINRVHAQGAASDAFRRFEIGFNPFSYLHQPDTNLYGGSLSFAVRASERIGIVADLAIHETLEETVQNPKVSITTYGFGPRYYAPPFRGMVPFGEIFIGGTRQTISTTTTFLGGAGKTTTSISRDGFAFGIGGGLDMKVKPWFAWRAIQGGYSLRHIEGGTANGFRLATGIVFRFGP